jgi:hypothetical protein
MKRFVVLLFAILLTSSAAYGQKSRTVRKIVKPADTKSSVVIVDERLSVLRKEPSLYADPIKRLKTGSLLTVFDQKKADGVLFFKVSDRTALTGWIQGQAFAGTFRKNDDFGLVRLIHGSSGFIQIQRCAIFLNLFPTSELRPTILLLFGDRIESLADAISKRAKETLIDREMAAAKAPVHSFYLNYHELDRYRALGIRFFFNEETNTLHYSGDAWFEITTNHPNSEATIEARERIKSLTTLMDKGKN